MNSNKTRTSVALLTLILSALITGCGQSPKRSAPEPIEPTSIEYEVKRGDRLSDIAIQFTGDQALWRAIADFNNIENPRKLREGALLQIPTDLIPGYAANVNEDPSNARIKNAPEVSPSLAMKKAQDAETPGVVLTPIPNRQQFKLNPIQADNQPTNHPPRATNGQSIKVVGSYYPKGIYAEPQTSSQLLLRATPGTIFALNSTIDGWFKIETDTGTGFIRHADATLLDQ